MKISILNSIKANSYKLLFLICTIPAGFGCNPDLVGEPPMGRTEETYFNNATEFRTKLVSVYASLYDHYHFAAPSTNFNGWITGTYLLPGDDLTENLAARTGVELFDGSLNPTNTQVGFSFQSCYKTVARANVILDKIRNKDISGMDDPEEIAMMEGEALFLRAYVYFKLFNVFGGVPIVRERIQLESETNTPRSTPNEVITQVIDDARAAIPFLPESWPENYAGRATKNSARGLLAKALVFRANYNNDESADLQEALTIFNGITASLVPDFIDNFSAFTENNQESLFEIQAGQASAISNLILHNDGAWRGVENLTVYRGYMMEAGGRGDFNDASATKFLITDKLRNGFGNDPRLSVFSNADDGFDGLIFQKYNKPDGVNELTPPHGGSANNERVLRYADLKLIAAEAAIKTGDATAAINHINEVRTRARNWAGESGYGDGINPANYPTSETSETTIMQWIMDERFVELAGEGQRWWDLKRWHASGDMDLTGWDGSEANFSTALVSPVQFDVNKHLLFPLPQAEIERNSAITENNPGY
ncbi:RagB/SusD family nutrient uptake outer membrane protein [Cyclobacterium salsum]|uniref:RagB/SusD family nutrient uptake outer membrane protein n=1 Tax=Cyclobacterium salsum TaxID=2666329 RepID=UPI00139076B3|nr:RagB/SusD family nutrient uptake outer membrane protein [Cyclobacterium salsum]